MILIDPPTWPGHGRMWSHVASDSSLEELHLFAARAGIPRRAFEGDHYDVPAERYRAMIDAGAVPTAPRDLLAAIVAAGLRKPRRRGEEVIRSRETTDFYPGAGRCRVDVILSDLQIPAQSSRPGWWIDIRGSLIRVQVGADGWELPPLTVGQTGGLPLGYVRVKLLDQPSRSYRGPLPWVFQPARRPDRRMPGTWVGISDLARKMARDEIWTLVERLALQEQQPQDDSGTAEQHSISERQSDTA